MSVWNSRPRRRTAFVALALCAALTAAAGCGSNDDKGGSSSSGGNASTSGAGSTTHVKIRTAFVANGGDAPFFYAQKLGLYKREGVDVDIVDSKGSAQTITDVNAGGSDFGEANATNVMLAAATGQKVIGVASVVGKSSFAFFVPRDSGITKPSQLKGHTIVATALVAPNMYAALAAAGLSKTDVKAVFADATALPTTYMSGKVDAMYGTAAYAAVVARRPSNLLLQSDFGYNPPDYALITSSDTLNSNPDLVRGVTRATLAGFEAAKRDPQAAVDALLEKHPELDPAVALGTLRAVIGFMCSSTQAGKPYGQNVPDDWARTTSALKQFGGLRTDGDGSDFFTNQLFEGQDAINVGTC
ncbi:MAG TPA: ABC transporter substrate-binding protein [Conexibacter sp.]|nr:ABC transporter substrate-binding protein [Conexibacter sp.]